jgi:hypothetical protein
MIACSISSMTTLVCSISSIVVPKNSSGEIKTEKRWEVKVNITRQQGGGKGHGGYYACKQKIRFILSRFVARSGGGRDHGGYYACKQKVRSILSRFVARSRGGRDHGGYYACKQKVRSILSGFVAREAGEEGIMVVIMHASKR